MAENRLRKNVNSITVSGNLVKDGEIKEVAKGFNVFKFSIANNYLQKKGDSYQQEVNYFDVKTFGKQAESLSKILKKGCSVIVSGVLRQERWTDKDNKTVSRIVINADEIEITRFPSNGNGQQTQGGAPEAFHEDFPDGIPF